MASTRAVEEGHKTIQKRIADAIRVSDNNTVRASLAEEVLGFLWSRDISNYQRLPAFADVDAAWCDLLLETETYKEICAELFGFFLHRDGQWEPEILSTMTIVRGDACGVSVYYRNMTAGEPRRFLSEPSWDCVLPKEMDSIQDALPYVERAFPPSLGDASRLRILSREVLGFLKLKVMLGDVHPLYIVSPPSDVDQGWHALIIQTKLYEELSAFLLHTLGRRSRSDLSLSNQIVHHSMYQDGDDEGRQTRLARTREALMGQLSPNQRKKVTLNVEMADWVGYAIPTAFSLLL